MSGRGSRGGGPLIAAAVTPWCRHQALLGSYTQHATVAPLPTPGRSGRRTITPHLLRHAGALLVKPQPDQ
jgi:hypothetical protein